MKVLVIDRETFLAELVRLALEADGHACFTAANIDEASEILRSVRIDLVSLDLESDGRNPLGWLADAVLARPELHGRILVLADRLPEHDEATQIQACGASIIRKPFTLHQIRESVRKLTPTTARPTESRSRGPEIETS